MMKSKERPGRPKEGPAGPPSLLGLLITEEPYLSIWHKLNKRAMITIALWLLFVVYSILVWQKSRLGDPHTFSLFGLFALALLSGLALVAPGPSLLVVLIAGNTYNPILVGIIMGTGAGLGELSGYFLGLNGKVFLKETTMYLRIKQWMAKNGLLTIFLLAAIPNIFIDMGSLVAGATRFSVLRFLGACVAGKIIRFTFGAYVGRLGWEAASYFFK